MQPGEIEDIQALITIFFPFAEEMIGKFGKFLPFAGATTSTGDYVSVGNMEKIKHLETIQIVNELKRSLKEGSSRFLVVALFYEATVTNSDTGMKSDAVAVFVEHKNGSAAYEFFYPYRVDEKDQFVVNDSWGNNVEREIF
jgi:hypothetical protein